LTGLQDQSKKSSFRQIEPDANALQEFNGNPERTYGSVSAYNAAFVIYDFRYFPILNHAADRGILYRQIVTIITGPAASLAGFVPTVLVVCDIIDKSFN